MSRLSQSFLLIGFTAILIGLSGCFTEVGNAEDERLIKAEFKTDYSPNPQVLGKSTALSHTLNSLQITQFYMLLHEAEFTIKDSITQNSVTKHLWKDYSLSYPIDFTGFDPKASLSVERIGTAEPESFTLGFKISQHSNLDPLSIDFTEFKDVGFMKGNFTIDTMKTDFIFSLPTIKDFHLSYSKSTLLTWLNGNSYNCQIAFFARKWMENADLSQATKVKDMNGHEFILLDFSHNATQFKVLTNSFKSSFNAAKVF